MAITRTYTKPADAISGISITDQYGDMVLVSRSGDGLVVSATSADEDAKVDVLITPDELDVILRTLVPYDALVAALATVGG